MAAAPPAGAVAEAQLEEMVRQKQLRDQWLGRTGGHWNPVEWASSIPTVQLGSYQQTMVRKIQRSASRVQIV